MADLVITEISPVLVVEQDTAPVGEVVDAGEMVVPDGTSGKLALADGNGVAPLNAPSGIALIEGNQANITVTYVKQGTLDVGDALDALDFGAILYLSEVAGKIETVAPTSDIAIGKVVPGWGNTTPDKLMQINL